MNLLFRKMKDDNQQSELYSVKAV